MFIGWQVMNLIVDNSDGRALMPIDGPASQKLYMTITYCMVARTVL